LSRVRQCFTTGRSSFQEVLPNVYKQDFETRKTGRFGLHWSVVPHSKKKEEEKEEKEKKEKEEEEEEEEKEAEEKGEVFLIYVYIVRVSFLCLISLLMPYITVHSIAYVM
jgi:hypothetical protein